MHGGYRCNMRWCMLTVTSAVASSCRRRTHGRVYLGAYFQQNGLWEQGLIATERHCPNTMLPSAARALWRAYGRRKYVSQPLCIHRTPGAIRRVPCHASVHTVTHALSARSCTTAYTERTEAHRESEGLTGSSHAYMQASFGQQRSEDCKPGDSAHTCPVCSRTVGTPNSIPCGQAKSTSRCCGDSTRAQRASGS